VYLQRVLTTSRKVDECKPLGDGGAAPATRGAPDAGAARGTRVRGRGLHSSTLGLSVNTLLGIGGALWGLFRGVLGGIRGCLGCVLCKKRLRLS